MEAVPRCEGTVNQVMGDGIMALLRAPLAGVARTVFRRGLSGGPGGTLNAEPGWREGAVRSHSGRSSERS
jgi:hypothetical protein